MKSIVRQLRTPQGGALLAALICLVVLSPAWYFLGQWYQEDQVQQEHAKAAEEISARATALALAVDQRIALLQGLYAFTRTEWPDTAFDQPFEVYCAGIYFNSTGVRTMIIAPQGVMRYIFPIYDASRLSGYDIINAPDPATRNDVQRAIHSRSITLGQPGELRQGGFGLTAWHAVYQGEGLWGLVAIAVDMDTVLQDAGLSDPTSDLEMALRDNLGYTFFGSGEVWQHSPLIQTIRLPEGSWELGGAPAEGWAGAVRPQVTVFQLASLVIVVLMGALVYLTVNRQGRLTQAVEQRTREIAAASQVLEQRVDERTHELSALLDVSRRIGSTLALEPLLALILTEIKPVLDYTAARIYRLDETSRLTLASSAGEAAFADHPSAPTLTQDHLQVRVIESLQPVIEHHWAACAACPDGLCWMGVPLVIKDRASGMLNFIHQDPGAYLEEDARLAMTFAHQVAVAIENARLYEQAGELAVLEERQRLARELHDSVSQVLYSIGLGSKTARAALDRDPAQLGEALDYVDRLAEAGQVEMRSLIFELRPESLQADGLVVALQRQAAVLRSRHQMDVSDSYCPEPEIPMKAKETLYRVSQEAIHNIVKHAHATRVSLRLECSGEQICLEISDNGAGFDPASAYPGHLGLRSMKERASRINGSLTIESAPGQGTRIRLVIPLKSA